MYCKKDNQNLVAGLWAQKYIALLIKYILKLSCVHMELFIRTRHLRMYLTSWNLGLTFKNWSLPVYRKVTYFSASWRFPCHLRFPMCIIHSSIYLVNLCWAFSVYHDVLGTQKWIKSISTLKQFIVWWKNRLINAVTEMKIRILCVKTRVFKLKHCFFIVQYKIHIDQDIKYMPTVEQIVMELHFMYSLCLLLLFNIL